MDSLGWDNPTAIRSDISSIPSCLWSNHYENFSESIEDYSNTGEKVELDQALLASGLELQGVDEEMVEILAPAALDLDFLQRREAIRLAADDSVLEKSGISAGWGDALPSQLCSSSPLPPPITSSKSVDPFDGLTTENFGSSEELRVFSDMTNDEGGGGGISTIFSNGENIPNNLSYSGNISSGESENHGSFNHHRSNRDEEAASVSQQPDRTRAHARAERAEAEPVTKRKTGESHPFHLPPLNSSAAEGGFHISFFANGPRPPKRSRSGRHSGTTTSGSIDFGCDGSYEPDTEAIAQVKEMIYRAAALRPVNLGAEDAVEKPKRKNVRISSDPQTVAARHRRERISEKLRVLQRLVPGGSKMDTASMLDEAANYLRFLKSQVKALETLVVALGDSPRPQTFPLGLAPSLAEGTVPLIRAKRALENTTNNVA